MTKPHTKYNFDQYVNCIYDQQGNKMNTHRLIVHKDIAPVWSPSLENELGCLSQGFKNRVKPQGAMDFI